MSTNQSHELEELNEDLDSVNEISVETSEVTEELVTETTDETTTDEGLVEIEASESKETEETSEIAEASPDTPDNLVPISEDIDPTKNPIYNKLEQLISLVQEKHESTDARLDALEPITESLTENTVDLSMRADDLENGQQVQETRTEALENDLQEQIDRLDNAEQAHLELAERTATLATATDNLRVENDRRADALENWTKSLEEKTNKSAEQIARLEGKTSELEQMDYQISEELDAERTRINKLTPRVEMMEDTADELLRDTADLQQDTGEIRKFFKTAVWSVAAVLLILAVATGTQYWLQNKNTLSIDGLLADLGLQQEKIAAVESRTSILQTKVQQIPAQLDAISNEVELQSKELSANINLATEEIARNNADIREIRQQIFIPDENLSSGAVDLSEIRGDEWLLEQPANAYTIQLVGVYGKNALSNFIGRYRKHFEMDQLAYLHTTHKGREWYVLVLGSYATAAEANAVMDSLSDSLQKNSPYVRQFDRIQERIEFRLAAK